MEYHEGPPLGRAIIGRIHELSSLVSKVARFYNTMGFIEGKRLHLL
jgi:hypothetical protein